MSEKYRLFENICRFPADKLKEVLFNILKDFYDDAVSEDGYLYAKGSEPILLTAHMDTVHVNPVKQINEATKDGKTIISSPQGIGGDDRCGVYLILNLLALTDFRPSILFCEDEEVGGIGSSKFCKSPYIDDLKELKFFIELDRANANDAVFYDCGNKEFKKFVCNVTGYKEAYGSFSDISHLSPVTDVASVNLSCGYYNAHTLEEKVVYEEMMDTLEVVKDLIYAARLEGKFDYQRETYYDWFGFGDGNGNGKEFYGVEVEFFNEKKGKTDYDFIWGETYLECMGQFFMDHPSVCFDDIIDVQEEYDDDYYYQGEGYGNVSAN